MEHQSRHGLEPFPFLRETKGELFRRPFPTIDRRRTSTTRFLQTFLEVTR